MTKAKYYVSEQQHELNGLHFTATRINNDLNGNPRYVMHELNIKTLFNGEIPSIFKKYRAKWYGGGYVIQSYNLIGDLLHEMQRRDIGYNLVTIARELGFAQTYNDYKLWFTRDEEGDTYKLTNADDNLIMFVTYDHITQDADTKTQYIAEGDTFALEVFNEISLHYLQ